MYIFRFCYHLINRLHGLFIITWPIVFPFHLSVLVSVTVLLLCIPTTFTLLFFSSLFKKLSLLLFLFLCLLLSDSDSSDDMEGKSIFQIAVETLTLTCLLSQRMLHSPSCTHSLLLTAENPLDYVSFIELVSQYYSVNNILPEGSAR